MIKQAIKTLLCSLSPKYYHSLMAARENRHEQWVMAQHGIPAIAKAVQDRHGMTVLTGPFAGMNYIAESAGSAFVPKLIGSYECELHKVVEKVLAQSYDTVVDVGSAEGYYAVGLALRLPDNPRITAFDINPKARSLCRLLAIKNNVEDKITSFASFQTA